MIFFLFFLCLQPCPWYTLACCSDVKLPSNKIVYICLSVWIAFQLFCVVRIKTKLCSQVCVCLYSTQLCRISRIQLPHMPHLRANCTGHAPEYVFGQGEGHEKQVWEWDLISSHLGFVHPLQDVALHQCLPSSSVCCLPNPGGSLLLCYVILPSSAWSSSRPLPSPWLPLCALPCPPIVL